MEKRHFHRRNLPHLYYDEGIYFITYRLADRLPKELIVKFSKDLKSLNGNFTLKEKRVFIRYDELIHKLMSGKNYLSRKDIAGCNQRIIHKFDGKEFKLICYCIMPNHIHLLIMLLKGNSGISKIMKNIKGSSSRECNRILNGSGNFWQDESFDRLVRDDKELFNIINYILNNPVKSALTDDWKKWPYTYCNPDFL